MLKKIAGICIIFFACGMIGYTPGCAASSKKAKATKASKTTKDDTAKVEESFAKFQQDWLAKLNEHGEYGEKNVQVEEDASQKGRYIAKYFVLNGPMDPEVKKTDQKASPYIGMMHYEKWMYTSTGKTPDEAKKGPFKVESQSGVTEMFRYSKGKWVY